MSAPDASPPPPRDPALVALFLAGPVLYALDMAASYFLIPHALHSHRKLALHALSAAALLAAAAATLYAARLWRALPPAEDGGDGVAQRRRFLASGGMLLGAFSILLIVGNEIGKAVHDLED